MTELGIIGEAPPLVIDEKGALTTPGGAVVDWWIGADDRWHRPAAEASVRQGLGPDSAAVETRVRVPGGDVVQRVTVVPSAGRAVALVEITNETPVPVALAVTVRGQASTRVYEDLLRFDDVPFVRFSRPVARLATASSADALADVVESGGAMAPTDLAGPLEGSHAACVFPLPHTAVLTAVVALDPDTAVPVASPLDLPTIADADRGWHTHLERGMRFSVPDDRLHTVVDAALRHLLIGSGQSPSSTFWRHTDPWAPAAGAVALAQWGHDVAARELLVHASADPLAGSDEVAGSLMWGWSQLLHTASDPSLLDALSDWAVTTVDRLVQSAPGRFFGRNRVLTPWTAAGLAAAPPVLSLLGHDDPASDVADALGRFRSTATGDAVVAALCGSLVGADGSVAAIAAVTAAKRGRHPLAELVGSAGPTGATGTSTRPHDPARSALVAIGARRALVYESAGVGGPVELLAGIDPTWLGAPMQVHRAPVGGGDVEFAVRWHGERPALLWDAHVDRPIRLTAPALDPSFADERVKAEALLAPTPGLASEPAPESPAVRPGQVLDPDLDDPSSFS